MKAEIICVGTEILLGQILNTNQQWLSQKLAECGIGVYYQSTVGDNPERLAEAVGLGLLRSDIVITSGGLGPTVDDITLSSILSLFPQGFVRTFENDVGTAPGYLFENAQKLVIALPGPPRELNPMFENKVAPFLKRRFKGSGVIRTRTLKVAGLPESKVDIKVKSLLKSPPPLTVGIYSKPSLVELKITAQARNERLADRMIDKADKKISSLLGGHIFGRDGETLEEVVGRKLTAARKTVAVAESCTGGLISGRLTDLPGSSVYFKGAVIAYSNEMKISILGVRPSTIRKFGAVSRQTAGEMASGVMRLAGTSYGLSVTGIAGPSGSTKNKPIGLVYVSLAGPGRSVCKEFRFRGNRSAIRSKASQAALDLIRVSL